MVGWQSHCALWCSWCLCSSRQTRMWVTSLSWWHCHWGESWKGESSPQLAIDPSDSFQHTQVLSREQAFTRTSGAESNNSLAINGTHLAASWAFRTSWSQAWLSLWGRCTMWCSCVAQIIHGQLVVKHACLHVENDNKSPDPAAFALHLCPLCIGRGHNTNTTPATLWVFVLRQRLSHQSPVMWVTVSRWV